jgi:signal transduction histidine kinase
MLLRVCFSTIRLLVRILTPPLRRAYGVVRSFATHVPKPLVALFGLILVGAVVLQVWATVSFSKKAVMNSDYLMNRRIAKSFAERIGTTAFKGSEYEVSKLLNEVSRLSPSVRLYIIDQHGIVVSTPNSYGKLRLPFVSMAPVKDFLGNQDSTRVILGDDPHDLHESAPISVTPLSVRGESHFMYVVLAPAASAHRSVLSGLGIGFLTLIGSLLTLGFVIFALLFVAQKRVQGLQGTVAALSHDLRAPLSSIQGYLETLLSRGGDLSGDDSQRFMSVALRSTHSAANMVNDLHQLSLLEAAGDSVEMEPLSLIDLVMDTLMAAKPTADEKRISLHWSVPPNVPLAHGNIPLLERLVRNLIENAIRYTPAGGRIEVVFDILADSIQITVTDSGVGIREDELKKVSQAFFRGSNTKAKTKGSGIGLAICSRIAKIHGQELRILSREHEGTAVIFKVAQAEQAYH